MYRVRIALAHPFHLQLNNFVVTHTKTEQRTALLDIATESPGCLPPPPALEPLRVEKDGKTRAVIALTDIDGTTTNELLPEKERLFSIGPALEPIKTLERTHSIPMGIITGRSYGEAKFYREKLGGSGPLICENGALISIPGVLPEVAAAARERGFSAYQLPTELLVIPSRVRPDDLVGALERFDKEWARKSGTVLSPTTSLSSVERLGEDLKYATIEDAARAAERVASVFVMLRSSEERAFLEALLKDTPITVAGRDFSHLLPRDCDKGAALGVLTELLTIAFAKQDPVSGVVPIIFGNGENDLPSLNTAEKLGGKGVLIAHPEGGYAADVKKLPSSIICSLQPFGHGIAEVLPRITEWLYHEHKPAG